MSSKDEWARYQEALRSGNAAAAAQALRRYQEARRQEGKGGSKPTLVNLSTRDKPYPHALPLVQVPHEMEKNPEFFELMKKASGGR